MESPRKMMFLYFSIIFGSSFLFCSAAKDDFTEELFIKPHSSGHTSFHFQFTTTWNVDISNDSFSHYRLFPKTLGDVLSTYKVQELHLTMTQGFWRYEKWGFPVVDAPPGAQLWVWFQPTVNNIDQTWSELVNALSGLFCASLNFMDGKSTVQPKWTFRPQGIATEDYSLHSPFLRYSALPSELVCTENLTPWKKLLPCESKVGLSTLFNAVKLYDSNYHSLGIHFRPVCETESCESPAVELSQTVTLVYDTVRMGFGSQVWNLRSIFGKSLTTQCPVASASKIFVDITQNKSNVFELVPKPSVIKNFMRGGVAYKYAVYTVGEHIDDGKVLNVMMKYRTEHQYTDFSPPPITAHRFVTGYGLDKGGITCQITNSLPVNLTVIYMETVPWFLRVFYKSLKIQNQGNDVLPYKQHYIPGKDRIRPYHLEVVFRLRANSVTTISLQFERTFLKWTEYPPDANHGFYVNSAVISTKLPTAENYTSTPQFSAQISTVTEDDWEGFFLRMYTESLLVSLPTPDFSMPYNVICLACTVVAIAFGSVHNLTTRSFVIKDPSKQKGLLRKVKDFFIKPKPEDGEKKEPKDDIKNKEDDSGGVNNKEGGGDTNDIDDIKTAEK